MSEERDINLGQVIKDSDFQDKKKQIAQKLKDNPYSQPLHRLASKLNMDNNLPIHQYAWLEKSTEPVVDDKVMTISGINLKGKSMKASPIYTPPLGTTPPVAEKSNLVAESTDHQVKKQVEISKAISHNTDTQSLSSFTQWLNKKAKPLSSTSELSDKSHKTEEDDISSSISEEMTPPANKSQIAQPSEKKAVKTMAKSKAKKSAIGLSKKKKKKTKLQKKIDASLLDHKNIASEPLAKLYKKQGFYKKSLKMYEQLSLINPEKSSFFAPLIEELKNKLK